MLDQSADNQQVIERCYPLPPQNTLMLSELPEPPIPLSEIGPIPPPPMFSSPSPTLLARQRQIPLSDCEDEGKCTYIYIHNEISINVIEPSERSIGAKLITRTANKILGCRLSDSYSLCNGLQISSDATRLVFYVNNMFVSILYDRRYSVFRCSAIIYKITSHIQWPAVLSEELFSVVYISLPSISFCR